MLFLDICPSQAAAQCDAEELVDHCLLPSDTGHRGVKKQEAQRTFDMFECWVGVTLKILKHTSCRLPAASCFSAVARVDSGRVGQVCADSGFWIFERSGRSGIFERSGRSGINLRGAHAI